MSTKTGEGHSLEGKLELGLLAGHDVKNGYLEDHQAVEGTRDHALGLRARALTATRLVRRSVEHPVPGPTCSTRRRRVRRQDLLERVVGEVLATASPAPLERLPLDSRWL